MAAEVAAQPPMPPAGQDSGLPSILSRVWLSGQVNIVAQGNGAFKSPYQGPNSFRPGSRGQVSRVLTLYTGLRVTERTNILFDVERTSGDNLSRALGIAAYPNLDTVGVPNNNPYIARAMVHHSFGLGGDEIEVTRGPLQLAAKVPVKRLDLYVGKFSLPDFFDVNAVGGDSHFQFLNWSVNNNAAYGYPSETRGYTYGAVLEYHQPRWAVRFAEALQARADNPDRIDSRIGRSHSENLEVEVGTSFLPRLAGMVRVLSFFNHGPLALYRDAIKGTASGEPDVANHRSPRRKYGFGVNLEQELTADLRGYARLGWAEGKAESLANTEANDAVSGGFDLTGKRWRRADDKLGGAMAVSGLSGDHRAYLALGGTGAVLGDGQLNYRREKIAEWYYTARVRPGVYVSVDVQRIWNPGYNRDRGPIWVGAFRLHLEACLLKEPR